MSTVNTPADTASRPLSDALAPHADALAPSADALAPSADALAPSAPIERPASPAHTASPELRRQELAAFLRSRRERITPEQVGLPSTGRRRTPGLRREEVAQLASVGVTWYTWLEQGRDIQVSGQVLAAVSRALLLDPNERAHLYTLAGAADPVPSKDCPIVTPVVQRVLDQLAPLPACVLNARYDVLAYNDMYVKLLGELDDLPFEQRNLIWLLFTDPGYRARYLDPEAASRTVVARLRTGLAEHVGDPAWKALLNRLRQASPEFEEAWARYDVAAQVAGGIKGFVHPVVGSLRMNYTSMWLGPRQGARVTVYTPSDEDSEARLQQLARP
ncbi:helix-turn-helix domain-containing protein [Kitasatospora acidiphila]|uniref:Helix-turn-helix domain-containing protein n=1 Tax=Kitasatospora acidiphila TaxID=2567942 RepID=A0A540W8Z6_9ACTN|nr:helix-turn-helix transcriptional regulator [Kitasatospora acidiphila]TQF05481.1 helix-turn-helix domain-containing protein [Kitasatospora acidiphila]